MRWLFVFVVLLVGCSDGLNPPPKIEVEVNDNTENTTVTVFYQHHDSNNRGCSETLKTPEELKAYREQVEFLLNRLDEAEKRMKVHEPENEKE